MKKSINNLLSKSEIKFWIGIIAIIVSIVVANQNVATEIALMKQEVATLSENTKVTNEKFTEIHKDTINNTLAITVIETIMEIK